MAIKVVCSCGAKFAAREELAGKAIECTACGKKVQVPHPAPAGASAGGKGLMAIMLTILTAAVAGGGYMLYTQQERIADLQGSVDKLDGALAATTRRLDAAKEELVANAKAIEATSAGQLTDKAAIAAVQKDLSAEADKRKALVLDLDRIDSDTLRIRGDLERAEKERNDAWAKISQANRDKQKEYDTQLDKLQEQLAAKADDQATRDRIAAEVKQIEDAKDALVKQAEQDRLQLRSYDSKIDGLKTRLQNKTTQQNNLQAQLNAANGKLSALQRTVSRKPLQTQIQTLRNKVDETAAEPFQAIVFDDQPRGESMWFQLNTSNGRVEYKFGSSSRHSIPGGPSFGGWGQKQKAGRYVLRLTSRATGRAHDVVLLDSDTGRVWACKIGARAPGNLRWAPVMSPASWWNRPRKAGKFRISVSRDGGSSRPLLVLTGPDGAVWDDGRTHRVMLVPAY